MSLFGPNEVFQKKVYRKDESFDPIYTQVSKKFLLRSRVYPALSISVGIFILITQIIVPLVFFKTTDTVTKPVASTVLGVASGFNKFEFSELDSTPPTNAPGVKGAKVDIKENTPDTFSLTIPKLGIEEALVQTNAASLSPDDYIGHYPGSALPGEVGNAYLYGHSVLPFFYNPKNYKTIFSTLNELNPGDSFSVKYNNKNYSYKVDSVNVLKVEDVHPLASVKPSYLNKSTLVLMTCWPPGTKSKRLEVTATMQNL